MAKTTITQFRWEVEIDGSLNEDLTSQLFCFTISNSLNNVWPIFYLYFQTDNQDIIDNDIYGSQIITVKIYYTTENGEDIGDPIVYNLLYLQSNLDLPDKHQDNQDVETAKEKVKRNVKVQCLSQEAALGLTQFVNKLYEEETGMTPLDFVMDILDYRGIEYEIEPDGMNENTVQQLIVPPMTVRSAIDYIDEKFGIYKGPLFRYMDYTGKFHMWDLKKHYDKFKGSGLFREHKLPVYTQSKSLYNDVNEEVAESKDQFLTYDNFETLHYGNDVMMSNGYQNIYITHPHEDIFHMLKTETPDIITKYGIWHDNDKMKYYEGLKHRKIYYHDMKGFEVDSGYTGEYDDHIITSQIANAFKDAFAIRFVMYRNVKIPYAEAVGDVVNFKPYSEHENQPGKNYAGGYVIKDSVIMFNKHNRQGMTEDNIVCTAKVTAFRTVQTKD